jgi:hypothetical protein
MTSKPYEVWHHTAITDREKNGRRALKGDITEFWVSNWPAEKIMKEHGTRDITEYAAAVFPVNSENSAEEQQTRAKVFCNYMNKLKEAEERARAGVEMGFMK